MRNFPLFLNTKDETIVIVGGGETATQKARLVARSEARLRVMAESLTDELASLVASGRAEHIKSTLSPTDLHARLVIVATECAAFDAAVADLARRAGALVNVVDRPLLCDVNMPAIVDRDPVVVAIGTEGTAPVLARRIKSTLETLLEPGLGDLASLAGRLRPRVAYRIAPKDRRAFWDWFFGPVRKAFRSGQRSEAMKEIEEVMNEGQTPNRELGQIVLIEVPITDPDLIPLRAVSHLQSADHLAIGGHVPMEVIELARRDAERSSLDDEAGARAARHAEAGQNFVALTTNASELAALRHDLVAQGHSVETVRYAKQDAMDQKLRLAS